MVLLWQKIRSILMILICLPICLFCLVLCFTLLFHLGKCASWKRHTKNEVFESTDTFYKKSLSMSLILTVIRGQVEKRAEFL